MRTEIIQKLLDINGQFYQSFGAAFAETRQRIQPGVQRIVEQRIQNGDWLDIGCGNGVLGQRLAQRGLQGSYLGLDFSEPLLAEATEGISKLDPHPDFVPGYRQVNLLDDKWADAAGDQLFDGILAFAVLHHIPGADCRERLIQQISSLLKPGGVFIHSEWQFQNSPKLMTRVQPWQLAGLSEDEVEEGDTLLDWRHQSASSGAAEPGLRYVHLFTRVELDELAQAAGFKLIEEFDSDGATGNLGLYQVWQKIS
jgi:tRNA (uracil-5-)-methyltransferase TRM9